MRPGFLAVLIAAGLSAPAAERDLPKQAGKGGEIEAAELFRGESGDVLFPNAKLSDTDFLLATEPPADLERAQTTYERARSKEQRWQRLCKAGVLAQVEVERVTLQVARSRVSLERARVAQQEAALAELRGRAGRRRISSAPRNPRWKPRGPCWRKRRPRSGAPSCFLPRRMSTASAGCSNWARARRRCCSARKPCSRN